MVALLFFPLSSAPTRQGLSRTPSHLRPVPRVRRCALDFVSNPQRFFEACRKKHGDTFIIYVFGVRMLCTFSPEVRSGSACCCPRRGARPRRAGCMRCALLAAQSHPATSILNAAVAVGRVLTVQNARARRKLYAGHQGPAQPQSASRGAWEGASAPLCALREALVGSLSATYELRAVLRDIVQQHREGS